LALLFLSFWVPAFANVHLAVSSEFVDSRMTRIAAVVRAFGMLLCSAALAVPVVGLISPRAAVLVPLFFVAGLVLSLGSCFFGHRRG
jgi:hypothetical protein